MGLWHTLKRIAWHVREPHRRTVGRWTWFDPEGAALIVSANPNTNSGQAQLQNERIAKRAMALRARIRAGIGSGDVGF